MIEIAVLLTCHNRKEKTIACLTNLKTKAGKDSNYFLHIFLVDDGSTDGTYEAVSTAFPEVKITKGNGSLFWNRGMHLAWTKALEYQQRYDYFLWLNDDTDLLENAIEELIFCSKSYDDMALVCGAVSSALTGEFTYGGRQKNGEVVYPGPEINKCHSINGNCVLISYKVFTSVGNLDPVFPHAIGDYDYGLRAMKKGFNIITTRNFIGHCERNAKLPKWCYKSVPLTERFKSLYSPLGNSHPYYFFIFESRHYGILTAIKHYMLIHLRALFPSLWQ